MAKSYKIFGDRRIIRKEVAVVSAKDYPEAVRKSQKLGFIGAKTKISKLR